jgi:ketosteroid isomerase-like protein
MTETNAEACRRAYAAFASGDMATLSELIAPDTTWIVGGRNALSGVYHGRDATFGYFEKLFDATGGTFRLQLLTLTEIVPDTVLACLHVNATAHGITFDEELVQQLHLRNGQAIACRTFVESGHLWDEVVGPATITLPAQQVKTAATAG